ncbi:hypothetical protein AB0J40_12630 [Amycolatopsis sp. NPDC049691]|uniref:hypothetical protein n=1 Tax=Amycolatopsis sp. NPDC049691 TaxID=3155155 RepID=UPI00342573DA
MSIRSRQLGERLLQRMAEKNWGVREISRKLEMGAQWVSSEFIVDLANKLYSSGADHDVDLA